MSPRRRHRPDRKDAGDGGIAARRAVVRWSWRLFRREWRAQSLVLALLTLTVAAVIWGVSAVYAVAPSGAAKFGAANYLLRFDGGDQRALATNIAAARTWFGTIDVIGRRSDRVPGSVETTQLRAQDPAGPFSGPMLALRAGRYPTGSDQVAVTDHTAELLGLRVGAQFELDGRHRTVVGIVENPADLSDEFALVSPATAGPAQSTTVLVNASPDRVEAFRDTIAAPLFREARGGNPRTAAAAGALAAATILLLLVSLVAATGFVVVAHRRLRQLGMLAAIGATQKHLRLVLLANGIVVGATAALAGTLAGLVGWFATAPRLETAAAHRIDRFDVPWLLIAAGMLLAVGTATAVAWWPARAVARVPITLALSARPPRPMPTHRSATVAGVLIAAGIGCLTLAHRTNSWLIIAGTVATAVGVLFVSPLAIRTLAAAGARLPVAVRLALRDLARYQARSGAALAAISLALAIVVTIVIAATAAQDTAATGNLTSRQLLIRIGQPDEPIIPLHPAAEVTAGAERIAGTLGQPTLLPLDMAVDPAASPEPPTEDSDGGQPVVDLARRVDARTYAAIPLYVATPDLLRYLGIDPGTVRPDTDLLTAEAGELLVVDAARKGGPPSTAPRVQRAYAPGAEPASAAYSSLPASLITLDALHRRGWRQLRVGWLVESAQPLTVAQLAAARHAAAEAGLTIEARRDQASLLQLRSGATGAGALLALGVLALTVGLIRGEAAGDLRTLTAAGATSRTRRTLTAATAGALALLGALLGSAGAYLALIAWYHSDLGTLGRVPVSHLAVTAVGLPLVAALAGWLLAGREPPSLARKPLE